MLSLTYYVKAIECCQSLEDEGLVSIEMPESNVFLSDKLVGEQRALAVEAIGVYVRVFSLMRVATNCLKVVSGLLALVVACQAIQ